MNPEIDSEPREHPHRQDLTDRALSGPHGANERAGMRLAIERVDRGTPRCRCGSFKVWVRHGWACPECDGETGHRG